MDTDYKRQKRKKEKERNTQHYKSLPRPEPPRKRTRDKRPTWYYNVSPVKSTVHTHAAYGLLCYVTFNPSPLIQKSRCLLGSGAFLPIGRANFSLALLPVRLRKASRLPAREGPTVPKGKQTLVKRGVRRMHYGTRALSVPIFNRGHYQYAAAALIGALLPCLVVRQHAKSSASSHQSWETSTCGINMRYQRYKNKILRTTISRM